MARSTASFPDGMTAASAFVTLGLGNDIDGLIALIDDTDNEIVADAVIDLVAQVVGFAHQLAEQSGVDPAVAWADHLRRRAELGLTTAAEVDAEMGDALMPGVGDQAA